MSLPLLPKIWVDKESYDNLPHIPKILHARQNTSNAYQLQLSHFCWETKAVMTSSHSFVLMLVSKYVYSDIGDQFVHY